MSTQLSLFETEREAAQREWTARFERADWTAPYDCGDGTPKGTVISGWRCPACGEIEANSFLLSINHGFPEVRPVYFDETRFVVCTAMSLRRAHAAADARRARS